MFKKLFYMALFLAAFVFGLASVVSVAPSEFSRVFYSFSDFGILSAIAAAGVAAISFSEIPGGIRVPWTYIEFSNENAIAGGQNMPHKIAIIGQKLASGTQAAGTVVRVTSYAQAKTLFGAGSMLAFMAETLFKNNTFTEAWFFPLDEAGAGTKATAKISFVNSSAQAGTLYLYIGGRRITVGVTDNMTATQLATATVAAITAKAGDLPVTAAVNGTNAFEVDLTCKWKGTTGNKIDVSLNYYDGETTPIGVTPTITAFSGGATDPDVQDALDLLGEVHYTELVNPYTDGSSLTAVVAALSARNAATVQLDGYAFHGASDTLGNLSTLGDSKNSQFLIIIGAYNSPTPPWEWAAALAGVCAFEAANDPAKPVQTVELKGILPPRKADRFLMNERNILLYDGISTFTVDANGATRIERVITTYKTNPAGADDPSYLDWETMATLSYLRYDFRNTFLRKFPRFKLADDGNRYTPDQNVMTPKTAKAEAVAIFKNWEERALVENADAFKEALVVVRDVADRNRLNFELAPDLINQLRVNAVKISFIL